MASKHLPLQLSQNVRGLILGCQILNLALLYQQLSLSLFAIMVLCVIWQAAMLVNVLRTPANWLVQSIALICCILLVLLGRQLGLLLAMVHLMCFSYVLKTLQIKRLADLYLIVMQGYFILASILIFSQHMLVVFAVLMLFTANTSILIFHFSQAEQFKSNIRTALKLVLMSIPLALVLFVFFPKLSPFWQVPLAKSTTTGLSDQVAPGDIANLVQSDDLVFRAVFEQSAPPYPQRYWRTLVMDEYDGRRWQVSARMKQIDRQILRKRLPQVETNIRPDISYQIIAQASYQPWLYHLTHSVSDTKDVLRLPANRLAKDTPITQTYSYKVSSKLSPDEHSYELSNFWRAHYTQLPNNANPKLAAWAKSLYAASDSTADFASQISQYITRENFRYTLSPGLLENNSLDQFFFESQAGFCVHYASSIAFAFRAANIPARLVTGYMGGELNPQGNYYAVFQFDAHAWLEYWTVEAGWQRFDPTAAVNPARVERGINSALTGNDEFYGGGMLSLNQYRHIALLNYIRLQLDSLDYQWTKWVLNYSVDKQTDLLKKLLGTGYLWKNSLVISTALIMTLAILWFALVRRNRAAVPWQIQQIERLERQLKKQGIERLPEQSLHQYLCIVKQQLPQAKQVLDAIERNFNHLHYQKLNDGMNNKIKNELKTNINRARKLL